MPSEIPKELIVDASILFSFFKASSARRGVFKKLLEHACKLNSPDFVLDELSDNKGDIIKFARIDEVDFSGVISGLNNDLDTFKEEEYKEFLSEANKISPHGEETKDDPYFALALFLNCAVWSDEEAFKKQSRIKVHNTKELSKLLEKNIEGDKSGSEDKAKESKDE